MQELLSIKEASEWATNFLGKKVTTSNISYLIQYGRVKKIGDNGFTQISSKELLKYYQSVNGKREISWKNQLGQDSNWALSFDQYKEFETTKHVHRLHPYKGKFIHKLVEYFLDEHTDQFKKSIYLKKGDIVLDPFSGSGTTMVQANELGIHTIGIDVSEFNSMIGNSKITKYDLPDVQREMDKITIALKDFLADSRTIEFEEKLLKALYDFNNVHFPTPEYKYRLKRGQINEDKYGLEKEREFLPIFRKLVKQYNIKLKQDKTDSFLDLWYLEHIRTEIEFLKNKIEKINNKDKEYNKDHT